MIQLEELEICPYCYNEVRMLISEYDENEDIECPVCHKVL